MLTITNARLHNLKNVTLSIPKNRLVVFTGVSGSGKSTLGFDILFREGQRQYLESYGLISYGFARPPVDSITGLAPTISVDQAVANTSPRSTVGTATEVYTYLRVLFARLGRRPCPRCGREVPPPYDSTLAWDAGEDDATADASEETIPCPHCGAPLPALSMASFSFNKPAGACPTCTGLGYLQQADPTRLLDDSKTIAGGALLGREPGYVAYYSDILRAAAGYYGFALDLDAPVADWPAAARDLLLYGVESAQFRRHYPGREPPATTRAGRFEGLAPNLLRRYAERVTDAAYREKMQAYLVTRACPDCLGERLRPESRAVRVDGRTIVEVARLSLDDLAGWLSALPAALNADEASVAAPILGELAGRIRHLSEAGAGYLTIERPSPSLSAGEAQRLRLASLLGSGLTGLLYVFDEPTVGLHQRDTGRLLNLLRRLRDLGNTVLVIEHDLETIAAADWVVDFGPGAGRHGGQIVAQGTPAEIAAHPASLTGAYLSGRASIPVPARRRPPTPAAITIQGARHNNLQNLSVEIPLGLLVAVTGVSGSGKSSLVFDILARAAAQRLSGAQEVPGEHDAILGLEHLRRAIVIDQLPIGRVPRSNAATYADVFTPIREAFAAQPGARERDITARHFSFNVPGGRCERCQGAGVLSVPMHFLPDVDVRCPTCQGRRFTRETLAVTYHGLDIAQVLDLTIDEALALFAGVPAARARLQVLSDVGLGYLQLGQPATSLSDGEAQRVKLARELGRRAPGRALYLLDEPTTGLHPADVARLLAVLQRLVDAGHSVVVVEHNLHLVRAADWVIDLGPEGGPAGGRLIAQGTPEQIARVPASFTGQALKPLLP